jgi:hypothetical protein
MRMIRERFKIVEDTPVSDKLILLEKPEDAFEGISSLTNDLKGFVDRHENKLWLAAVCLVTIAVYYVATRPSGKKFAKVLK